MTKPLVSIIIVARDEEINIGRCLSAIKEQEVDFAYEVIVVDSGSSDRTVDKARSHGARVIEIERSSFQHGRTRHQASMQAQGEYLVYLVADATPADSNWLKTLVSAVASDDRVAGAYSRQVPRKGAGPIEAARLEHRASFGQERVIKEIRPEMDFWSLRPEERFYFCEFDDVSCCRRRSLLDRFPIPEVDWAEDLVWAREILLAGHRIVFEPASIVRHSHSDTVSHAFRRGYLDQAVVKRWFGVLYFDSGRALLRGYPRLFLERTGAIKRSGKDLFSRVGLNAWNAVRLAAEMAGNYLAAREPTVEHAVYDLAEVMTAATLPMIERGRSILKTRFTLGADTRKTLFMNPNSAAVSRLKIPGGARLKFGAAINPEARPRRTAPILFAAVINGEPIWVREIGPGRSGEEPCWIEGDVDLEPWEGKRIQFMFITRADNTDYAWAGWGSPRIVTRELSIKDRLSNWILESVRNKVMGEPLRHP